MFIYVVAEILRVPSYCVHGNNLEIISDHQTSLFVQSALLVATRAVCQVYKKSTATTALIIVPMR